MKINGNEIRPGNVIEHNNSLWVAVKTQAVKPGKGPAYNQVELKNLINGSKLNERFRSSETVEKVRLEQKDFQFLFTQGDMLVFMDNDTYEQMELAQEFVGERSAFLQDGMKVVVEMHEGRPIGVTLPDQVTLKIVEADPVVKGTNRGVLLQAGGAGKRRAHPGAALRYVGRKGDRRHERTHLYKAGRLVPHLIVPAAGVTLALEREGA
jgi:elongation factor P